MIKKLIATALVLAAAALLARIASPAVAQPNPVACDVSTVGTDVAVNCTQPVPYRLDVGKPTPGGNVTATVTF